MTVVKVEAAPEQPRLRGRPLLPIVGLPALLAAPLGALGAEWPFLGRWSCGIGTLSFTETTYSPGDRDLRITRIDSEGETFTLSLAEGGTGKGQLLLAMNPDGSMTGHSPVTGDSFLFQPQG